MSESRSFFGFRLFIYKIMCNFAAMKQTIITSIICLLASLNVCAKKQAGGWVVSWTTAIQLVEPHNMPPKPFLSGNSLRQIVQVSIPGDQVELKLSNEYNKEETEILGIEIAEALTEGAEPTIDEASTVQVTFGGKPGVTMQPGGSAVSDPVKFKLTPRKNVAITIHFGKASTQSISGHPGSRTTSYIVEGNSQDFSNAVRTDHWYYINSLLVPAKKGNRAIAVLGNSITDGRGTTTNGQNRWTDVLSERLLKNKKTKNVSVLNQGLGGNCVLFGGLGPTGRSRYERDVLKQEGVRYAIIFEGVNDLGGSRDGMQTANMLIETFQDMINKAHAQGITIYGATIMPFKGNGYYNESREAGRQHLNAWIREAGHFDGVIDFDAAMRDPEQPDRLNPAYLFENDWLHSNADGYQHMGEAIDLKLFEKK